MPASAQFCTVKSATYAHGSSLGSPTWDSLWGCKGTLEKRSCFLNYLTLNSINRSNNISLLRHVDENYCASSAGTKCNLRILCTMYLPSRWRKGTAPKRLVTDVMPLSWCLVCILKCNVREGFSGMRVNTCAGSRRRSGQHWALRLSPVVWQQSVLQ